MLQYFVLPEITKTLKALNKEPLIAFRRVLDQKLDDIDSEHLYDFFLTIIDDNSLDVTKELVVRMGKDFYEAIQCK